MFFMHLAPLIRRSFHFDVAVSTCVNAKSFVTQTLNSVDTLWETGQAAALLQNVFSVPC
jgi:hypothetical protein